MARRSTPSPSRPRPQPGSVSPPAVEAANEEPGSPPTSQRRNREPPAVVFSEEERLARFIRPTKQIWYPHLQERGTKE